MEERDDITLLRVIAQQRDEAAFDGFCERHRKHMFSVAFSMLRNAELAEDAVQEALLSIWLSDKAVQPTGTAKDWVLKIVIHKSLDLRRSRTQSAKREERMATEQSKSKVSLAEDIEGAEKLAVLKSHIDQLPELDRTLLTCSYCARMSHREIASLVGIPDRTVTDKIHQVLERLRMDLTKAGVAAVVPLLSKESLFEALAESHDCPPGMAERLKTRIKSHERALKSARSASTVHVAIVTLVILAAVSALILYRGHATSANHAAVSPSTPASSNAEPQDEINPPHLAQLLKKTYPVPCRREFLWEVLWNLDYTLGLQSAYPRSIGKSCSLTVEDSLTVQAALEKLSAEGGLELEYHDDTVVFWKRADDKILAGLEKKFKEGDTAARCEAVFDLACLGDKRIYPLLFKSLQDEEAAVVATGIAGLSEKHDSTLCYGIDVATIVEPLQKLLNSPSAGPQRSALAVLLGASRNQRAVPALLALLKDDDADVRSCAASGLSRIGDPRVAAALIELSSDPEGYVRCRAAIALGGLGRNWNPQVADPLVALSNSGDAARRVLAAFALGRTRNPHAAVPLIALSNDADTRVRGCAAFGLGTIGNPRAIDRLIELTKDPGVDVRARAVPALGHYRGDSNVDSLLTALLNDADSTRRKEALRVYLRYHGVASDNNNLLDLLNHSEPSVRASAASAQKYFGPDRDPRTLDPLIALLNSPDKNVRHRAAIALCQIPDPHAAAAIVPLLNDADVNIRALAGLALALARDPRVLDPLVKLLNDADADVRFNAADALGKTRDPRAIEPLFALLRDTEPAVQSEAAWALHDLKDPLADANALIDLLNDPVANVRVNAACLLGQVQDSRTVAPLVALLKDADADVRLAAAISLGRVRDPRAVAPLIALLKDARPNVRDDAAFALGQIRDPRAIQPLIALLNNVESRSAAALALGQIGDRRAAAPLRNFMHDPDFGEISAAALALTLIEAPRAIDSITGMLRDNNPAVRASAALALGKRRIARAYIALLNDPDARVRWAAISAMEQLITDGAELPAFSKSENDVNAIVRFYALCVQASPEFTSNDGGLDGLTRLILHLRPLRKKSELPARDKGDF